MIETETTWQDSGYDCDHCGGQIFRRTDHALGQSEDIYYQCRRCHCQWTLSGILLRIGDRRRCRAAMPHSDRSAQGGLPLDSRLLIILGMILLLLLVALGGLIWLRFLIPVAIGVFVILALFRLGREQEWW